MTDHNLWLDALNYHQQQGKTLAQAVSMADQWPFKYINGQQTPESEALEADKGQHKVSEYDLNQCEDALL